jgi:aminopeptidase
MTPDMTDASTSPDPDFLDKLAAIGVGVGVNLQPDQDLIVTSPVEALPLARRVANAAYAAGAGSVTTLLSDDGLTLAKYRNGSDAALDKAEGWLFEAMAKAYTSGTARLAISGANPLLLANEDGDKVARVAKAASLAAKPAMEAITSFRINWGIIPYPSPAWARQVFPDLDEAAAVARLTEAMVGICRLDRDDPVAAWSDHTAALRKRSGWLTEQNFSALHFTGPGTDLTVGLADGHRWIGGAGQAKNGVTCLPNIPTEEVFTTPHAARVDGTVRASKPLAHQGTVIDGIEVRFQGGRIVEAHATKGEAVFHRLLDSDEGARRLGEVALVPHSSPISQSGILFYNTLFDENAACHIALGQCYGECFADSERLGPDEISARGGNASMIHVDWMIGSAETDIDGITQDGTRVEVFRNGEWAS